MYYCFVLEDLIIADDDNPLFIQYMYAIHLNNGIVCDLANNRIVDQNKKEINICGSRVMLRASTGVLKQAIELLSRKGADLVEDASAINRILRWYDTDITQRKIVPVTRSELLAPSKELLSSYLSNRDAILFIKTVEKGISLKISARKLLDDATEIGNFFEEHGIDEKKSMLLTTWHTIKADSFGTVEARAFVIDGKILNVSRMLHSVKHSVPKTLRMAFKGKIDQLLLVSDFPKSFVIDMALFQYDNDYIPDVVELNPLSLAMCYVNNSVFSDVSEDIQNIYQNTNWGYEYCYDYMSHSDRYHLERKTGISYTFTSEDRFSF